MRAAIARPYSKPTSSASVRASSTGSRSSARASSVARRSSRRGGNARCVSSARGAVALRRPARRLVAGELDVEVAAARELLEVVAGDVGVEREPLGDLGRGHAVGAGADEQVDVAAGRVTEGAGDGGDGGGELVRS